MIIKNTEKKAAIEQVLYAHDKFKSSYFRRPNTNAAGRRDQEFDVRYTFTLKGHRYDIGQTVDISCKNVYYSLSVHVDDEKKDVRAVKKAFKILGEL